MPARTPFTFQPGPYTLVDPWLVYDQANVVRSVHPPARMERPIVTAAEDGNFQPYISVVRDPEDARFRMWYNVPRDTSGSHLAHLTTSDGIHWERPHQVLEDPSPIQFGASVIDEGPRFADPEHRYKFAYWAPDEGGEGGLHVAVSANGLNWRPLSASGSAVPADRRSHVLLPTSHDIVGLYRDPIRGCYIAFVSMVAPDEDQWFGERRIPHQSVSEDLVHWQKPWPIMKPEGGEFGETEFYGVSALLQRGHLMVALVKVLRDDLNPEPHLDAAGCGDLERKAAGIGYTVTAWSRDGRTWQRDVEPFLDRDSHAGYWDRAIAWIDEQVPVEDEVFFYYGGYARGHKVARFEDRQIGLARARRDRYAFYHAGATPGTLRTRPAELAASSLTLNATIDGPGHGFQARVLGTDHESIKGFDFDDCQRIAGDAVDLPVSWSRPLADLSGRRVCFEFRWTQGRLFGFDLK